MLIGIYANAAKDNGLHMAKKLADLLVRAGFSVCIHNSARDCGNLALPVFCDDSAVMPRIIITLGGDGTILAAVRLAARHSIPILGVNLGKIGFLTEITANELEKAVQSLKSGSYNVFERSMVSANFNGTVFSALNEISIMKKNTGRTICVTVRVRGELLSSFKCDGYIISTPTGSTAYALSAGGPIISPLARCVQLIPVNCHSLSTRPIIIDEEESIEVLTDEPSFVVADGEIVGELDGTVTVSRAKERAAFISIGETNFFDKLRVKLSGSI